MKLLLLLYLEDDDALVDSLLAEAGVRAYSRLPLEGHGEGQPGWYGEIAPYRSKMIFAVVPDERARAVFDGVGRHQVEDERHPLHAIEIRVEDCVCSGGVLPSYLMEN